MVEDVAEAKHPHDPAILGGLILKEPIPPLLWVGLIMVGAGIYLVNRPSPVAEGG